MGKAVVAIGYNGCQTVWMMRRNLIGALQSEGYDVAVLATRDPSAERLEAMGVRVIDLPMKMNTNPVTDLVLLARFRRELARLRPAAYLGYTAKPNIFGTLAARQLGIPVISNIAGLGVGFGSGSPLARVLKGLYRVSLNRASLVFFQNPDDARLFREEGVVTHDRTGVLPGSGADLTRYQPIPLPCRPPFRFLFAARMLRDKGVGELAEATRMLKAERDDFEVVLIGAADVDNPTVMPKRTLEGWQAEGLIEWKGFVDDIRPELAAAHVVVLPSYYREGTPRVLLESAAAGRPLITADSVGCREAVIDGRTGLLCRPRDSADLARAMRQMLDMTPEALAEMGLAGRRYMEERFDERFVIDRYLDALRRLAPAG